MDYLLISHHGSSYSTTDTFLSVINPQYAFVSCGSYLYPSQEVVTRLNNVNIKNIYSTFNCGLIGIFVNENSCFKMFFMANAVDLPLLVVLISFLFFFCIKHNFFENKMKLRYF